MKIIKVQIPKPNSNGLIITGVFQVTIQGGLTRLLESENQTQQGA